MADYNRATEIDSKCFRGNNNIGFVKFREGDVDGAIAEYAHAIALNPNYGLAYRNRGEARRKKGDLEGAMADFNRVSKLGVSND
jgi:tetratricopeptide (TPR) repeat protein